MDIKHIFVVNPIAGKGKQALFVANQLERYRGEYDITVYFTKCKGDATNYVRTRLEESSENELLRFYICGGDGSLNEAVNGIMRSGRDNYALGTFPAGSGNDFVKAIGGAEKYSDVEKLLCADIKKLDVIRAGSYYAVNAVHFGFDSCVAKVMSSVRHKPIIGGKHSYTTGVAAAFLSAMRSECTLKVDGEEFHNGSFLLCTIANGKYVGGRYMCAPYSKSDDGLLEVCLVKPVSRVRFLKLMKDYETGKHIESEKFKDIIYYRQARSIELNADTKFCYSLDGELINESNVKIDVLTRELNFIVCD